MTVGTNRNWKFYPSAGKPLLNMVPFPTDVNGAYPKVSIERDGKLMQISEGTVPITQACNYENYNPFVGLVGLPEY